VNHFNTKIIVRRDGQSSLRLKPKADNLAIYQAIARLGANVDLAMFNFDLNSYRTGYHMLQLNLGYIF